MSDFFFIFSVALNILAVAAIAGTLVQNRKINSERAYHSQIARDFTSLHSRYQQLQQKYSKYDKIIDAEAEAKRILDEANALISQTNSEVQRVNADIQQAKIKSDRLIQDAQQKARDIAGDALDARTTLNFMSRLLKP